jgi:hypothetical protein
MSKIFRRWYSKEHTKQPEQQFHLLNFAKTRAYRECAGSPIEAEILQKCALTNLI